MSYTTKTLKLVIPELSDPADITRTNENWNIIEEQIMQNQDDLAAISENIEAVELELEGVANEASIARQKAYEALTGCAPRHYYSTADLIAGTSELATGTLWLVYE